MRYRIYIDRANEETPWVIWYEVPGGHAVEQAQGVVVLVSSRTRQVPDPLRKTQYYMEAEGTLRWDGKIAIIG